MADRDVHENGSDEMHAYNGSIDVRIERALWQLIDEPKKDVSSELVSEFDHEELRNARNQLFGEAKAKAQRNGASGNDALADESTATLADPWRLIERR